MGKIQTSLDASEDQALIQDITREVRKMILGNPLAMYVTPASSKESLFTKVKESSEVLEISSQPKFKNNQGFAKWREKKVPAEAILLDTDDSELNKNRRIEGGRGRKSRRHKKKRSTLKRRRMKRRMTRKGKKRRHTKKRR